MKRKISLFAVILALVFALSGCSSSKTEYDEDTMISQADALISSFSQMSEKELDAFVQESGEIFRKYKQDPFAKDLLLAITNEIERKEKINADRNQF